MILFRVYITLANISEIYKKKIRKFYIIFDFKQMIDFIFNEIINNHPKKF